MSRQVEKVVTLMKQRADIPLPVLIAIDGHSAAGKSTFAQAVYRTLPNTTLIHTDDFYRPMVESESAALNAEEGYQRLYDWQRLEQEVLRPLSLGQPSRHRVYDWAKNQLGDWKAVEPREYAIIEGCYAARPEFKRYYDLIVFVETSQEERMKRQEARADATQEWLNRWDVAEKFYLTMYQPHLYADVRVSGC